MGLARSDGDAFREHFSRVGDLRALFPEAPVMCLTATASKLTRFKVKELMQLRQPMVFNESPDRPNIRLCVKRVAEVPVAIAWITNGLIKERAEFPRTIIYCRRIKECPEIYLHMEQTVGRNSSTLQDNVYDMIHSETPTHTKNHILDSFVTEDTLLRVLISTKVTGMTGHEHHKRSSLWMPVFH